MPNRILRDWTDSLPMAGLSPETERFFVRLIMKADDFGRFHGDERLLKAALFPLLPDVRLTKVRQWRDECVTADLTALYQDERGRKFLEIKRFNQRTRAKESKFPTPDKQMTVKCPSDDSHVRTETETETETDPPNPPSGGMDVQIPKLFGRIIRCITPKSKLDTARDKGEIRAWNNAKAKITDEDVELVEWFYRLRKSRDCNNTWNRKSGVAALLNQWTSQVEYAREMKFKNPDAPFNSPPKPKKADIPEPSFDWNNLLPDHMQGRSWSYWCENNPEESKQLADGVEPFENTMDSKELRELMKL